jgi:PAB-dependent poly(A)-specific ribonuclease subunit 3
LDEISKLETVSKVFPNISTGTYKATSSSSGNTCTLKRIISKELEFEEAELVISIFCSQLKKHPNIVQLKKCMMINEFESNDICVVYDFIPGCVSLEYKYFIETRRSPSESSLWSYTCQILMALKEIHDSGLAYRCLSPSTILLRGKQRIYLNSIGLMDFIDPSQKSLKELQFQDLKDLGYLLLNLSLKSKSSKEEMDLETSFKDLEASTMFSKEFIEFLKYLLNVKDLITVDVLIQKIFFKFLNEMKILEE